MVAQTEQKKDDLVKREIIWLKILFWIYLHCCAIYGLLLVFTQAKLMTTLYCFLLVMMSTLGNTIGAHRLWAHKTYTASWPLRLLLVTFQTLSLTGPVYDWVLDHRLHHKYHGTDNDKYNFKRGFLWAHMGNRYHTRNPAADNLHTQVDMRDVEEDPIVMWQYRLYWAFAIILGVILPLNTPMEYWDESGVSTLFVVGFLRITLSLHMVWLINSANILWGLDPLDKRSADTNLVFIVNKSLWPQYHYLLPFDYRSGEYGTYNEGCSTAFIRVFAALGWATELRTIDTNTIRECLPECVKFKKPLVKVLEEKAYKYNFEDLMKPFK
ncbi:hypothetical protein M8J76_005609 [Diaphorina citri]|nr:hypothetical protein M8J76_005609 [Diaphorina citri]